MKKRLLTLLTFCGLSLCGAAQNLIINGDFESGLSGWNNLAGNGSSATFAAATTDVHQGTQAYSATIATLGANAYDIQSLGPSWTAVSGQSYTLTFYAKSAVAGAVVRMLQQNANYLAKDFTLSTSWQQYSWTFTVAEVSPQLKFNFGFAANVGNTIYIDDIQLPLPAGSVNNSPFTDSVSVSLAGKHQVIEGIGASIAYYDSWLTSHPNKTDIYNILFPELGLSWLRLYNGWTDSLANNMTTNAEIISTATTLLGYQPTIQVTSWSPPAYLKQNNSVNGGEDATLIKTDGQYDYTEFGQWWKRSLVQYAANGIKPDYISIQNEPDFNPSYAGSIFNPSESETIAGYDAALDAVYTSIQSLNNPPKIIGPEVIGIGNNSVQNYVSSLNTAQLGAYAHHLYSGGDYSNPDSYLPAMQSLAASLPDKPIFMTEFAKLTSSDTSDALNLGWIIHNSLAIEGVSAYAHWDLFWGETGTLVSLDNPWNSPSTWSYTNGYKVEQPYYALKQFSRFVRPGWTRVDATTASTNLRSSAYANAAGDSMSVVLINTGYGTGSVKLKLDDFTFESASVYMTNGSALKCTNTGSYTSGSYLTLPPRSITTVALKKSTLTTGIEDADALTNSTACSVFPNPFTQQLTIAAKGNFHYQLMTITGSVVKEGDGNGKTELEAHYPQGIYLLKILQDSKIVVFKIVKE